MAFFKVSTDQDKIRDGGNGNYITKSGFYDIILKHVLVNKSSSGSESLDLVVDYNGQEQMIYQAIRLTNRNGEENFGAALFHKLCIVIGAEDGEEIGDPVEVQLPIGRNGEVKDCMELMDFRDQPVTFRIQLEYTKSDDRIYENKRIKNIFRTTDKATASEIVNKTEAGKQFKEEEQYQDLITYKDGLTAEDIQHWKKNGRNNGSTGTGEPKKTFQRHSFGRSAA